MSIRRIIEQLVDDPAQREAFRQSPEKYFADHGIEDAPSDLVGTAFVHYSDSAPIEHADAVSGIATRFGPVPFDETDLVDGVTDGAVDPFSTLGGVEPPLDELEIADPDHRSDGPDGDTERSVTGDDASDESSTDDSSTDDSATDETSTDETTNDQTSSDEPAPDENGSTPIEDDEVGELLDSYDGEEFDFAGDDLGGDDPFFEEVTADDVELDVRTHDFSSHSPLDDAPTGLGEAADDAPYESFDEDFGHDFADIDPEDLDLDDI